MPSNDQACWVRGEYEQIDTDNFEPGEGFRKFKESLHAPAVEINHGVFLTGIGNELWNGILVTNLSETDLMEVYLDELDRPLEVMSEKEQTYHLGKVLSPCIKTKTSAPFLGWQQQEIERAKPKLTNQ